MNKIKKVCINGQYFYCNRMRLYEYFLANGAKVVKQLPDLYNPNRTVWVFNSTDVVDLLNSYHELHNNNIRFELSN